MIFVECGHHGHHLMMLRPMFERLETRAVQRAMERAVWILSMTWAFFALVLVCHADHLLLPLQLRKLKFKLKTKMILWDYKEEKINRVMMSARLHLGLRQPSFLGTSAKVGLFIFENQAIDLYYQFKKKVKDQVRVVKLRLQDL